MIPPYAIIILKKFNIYITILTKKTVNCEEKQKKRKNFLLNFAFFLFRSPPVVVNQVTLNHASEQYQEHRQ